MFDVLLIRKYSYIHLFHSTLHPDGHNAGFLQTSDMTGLPSYLTVSVQATRLHKTSALNYYHFYMLDNKIVEHFNIQQSLYKSLQKINPGNLPIQPSLELFVPPWLSK